MPYIGKSIESGTFADLGFTGTFNSSTTDFNLGTQVGSSAQLIVSKNGVIQRPGTDFTLASNGSQISFTTAPASGDSIFIVEISGAVGGTVTPSDNSVGITQLNVSDGSSGQALTTNGSGTLSFASVGLAGIDDQSSSNDDQLTITDTAVVVNEDSDDVDFRVESNGNANMLFVSGGNDVVGISNEGDLGTGLHIKIADTGASVNSAADELVIEGTSTVGMSFLTNNDQDSNITFGDSDNNERGRIQYAHNGNFLAFHTDGSERARIGSNGDFLVNCTSLPSDSVKGFGIDAKGTIGMIVTASSATGGDSHMQMFNPNGQVGSIVTSGSGTAFNTSSDYRLKENEVAISDGITRLKTLKPYRFNFKVDKDTTVDGFFAHEVSSIVPEAITGTKDATETYTDDNGDEQTRIKPQAIDQAKLVPLLTAALKEAVTKIEALEARVTTLEG